jgi:biotin carboxyl carrier protein
MNANARQVSVIVAGQEYLVEIQDLNARPIIAQVGEQTFEVNITETLVEKPVVSATPQPVTAPQPGPVATQSIKAPEPVVAPGASKNTIVAPMPGDIIEICVQPGDKVSAGQELCSLEAMKMKNAIRSPRDGVIASVAVTRGQDVSYGEVLITLE